MKIITTLIATIILSGLLIGIDISTNVDSVNGAGYTTANITARVGSPYLFAATLAGTTWNVLHDTDIASSVAANGGSAGFRTWSGANTWHWISRSAYCFDLSGLPEDAEVIDVKIMARQFTNTPVWPGEYYAFADIDIAGNVPAVDEWNDHYLMNNLVTIPKSIMSYNLVAVYEWEEYTVPSIEIENVLSRDSNNETWLMFLSLYDYFDSPPAWIASKDQSISTYSSDADPSLKPYLVITYAETATPRTMHEETNDSDFVGVLTGSEDISGIDWNTPRAAFSDERVGFRLAGDPGTTFDLYFMKENGDIINSTNGSIKTDGYYHWYTDIDFNIEGWVRLSVVSQQNTRMYSTWGRIEPSPSATQRLLTVSAFDSYYPQYDNQFNSYVIYKNGIGWLYWKTNLVAGDMGDYSLKMLAGGSEDNTSWNATLEYINTNIFQTIDTDNYFAAHWRYMAFTPMIAGTGINTYDGFIQNVGKEYTLNYNGFWQGTIRADSDNSTITYTDSAYFYLNDPSQGVAITFPGTMTPGGSTDIKITVGSHCKVASRLSNLEVMVIDDLGEVYSVTSGYVEVGNNIITITMPPEDGNYQTRFTFYDDALVPDYAYIRDIDVIVVEAGGGVITPGETPDITGIKNWLENLIDGWGLNNTAGHYFIIFGLCVLWAVLFGIYGKMTLVATALVTLTIIAGLYLEWIDMWLLSLVALGVGFEIYRIFRKKSEARESEE